MPSALVDECATRSVELLVRNLTPEGILAATPGAEAHERGYDAIFSRDAAICALGMAVSGHPSLTAAAPNGLVTLARHQARNGQIPTRIDVAINEADFWYLGCIDATLWWLIALAWLDAFDPRHALREALDANVDAALGWLECQEHQRLFLLQQNEASDWADIMPRSGFVLYTNALWYLVKQQYGLRNAEATRATFQALFDPASDRAADDRRARLLADYAHSQARHRDLYLSFVNFSFAGDEGDAFGNVLAVLCGLADERAAQRTLAALKRAGADDPYPLRVVLDPIGEDHKLWRPYMSRHRQNYPGQYHNGGIWPFAGGFLAAALEQTGLAAEANDVLERCAKANALSDWAFAEWLHGRTLTPRGMRGQSWNAAAFLIARHALASSSRLFWPSSNADPRSPL